MINSRIAALKHWLNAYFPDTDIELTPLTGDAGFRHYYRFTAQGCDYIAVDALPETSNNYGFVEIAKALKKQGIKVPEVIAYDLSLGFLCISDFGRLLFADVISKRSATVHYQKAIDLLPLIAATSIDTEYNLPQYDKKFIEFELSIFNEWLLQHHLKITLSTEQEKQLSKCFAFLVDNALEQPQVFMHRDYHSRNIMCLDDDNSTLGIIDFQDAVKGPITYDIVSLLRDCYLRLPQEQVDELLYYFRNKVTTELSLTGISEQQWRRWFDLTGLQRHLKASGIFARLFHRDKKSGYLKDIPLTLEYIAEVSANYPELSFLNELISKQVQPALANIDGIDTSTLVN